LVQGALDHLQRVLLAHLVLLLYLVLLLQPVAAVVALLVAFLQILELLAHLEVLAAVVRRDLTAHTLLLLEALAFQGREMLERLVTVQTRNHTKAVAGVGRVL